uniref:LCN-type CS-alpha/beta domain-containing protein n=1 Tax=Isometrus maculatus TaxID=497827 RepID=A0A0U1S864_ISOMC|nr:hypothetical protein [Isometrus maculatus]
MKIILILFSMILLGVDCKEGYGVGKDGCKISCVIGNEFCNKECKYSQKGTGGYCWTWGLACWCEGLPEDAKVWESSTNTCGRK